jgi:hypothetical protein
VAINLRQARIDANLKSRLRPADSRWAVPYAARAPQNRTFRTRAHVRKGPFLLKNSGILSEAGLVLKAISTLAGGQLPRMLGG